MKKFIITLVVGFSFVLNPFFLNAQFNQFTFLKGNTTDFSFGSYGTQGVASVSNNPGLRSNTVTWQYNNKLYLFGGEGAGNSASVGYLNDLWEYDPTTNNWRSLKGTGGAAVYGTLGIFAASNTPGARKSSASWVLNNKLYLFGGYAGGRLNDMWEYDPSINQWRWLNGVSSVNVAATYGTIGVADATNNPGSRETMHPWVFNGKLYLFGGGKSGVSGDEALNDIWEYDPLTNLWRWIKGPNTTNVNGIYGTKGVADVANNPGGRMYGYGGIINDKFYMFGGFGFGAAGGYGQLNDLWEFDMTTNNWRWLTGINTTDGLGIHGTLQTYSPTNTPSARRAFTGTIGNGTFYVFGGFGNSQTPGGGQLNDLWEYDPSINQWRWLKGQTNINNTGVYGYVGVAAVSSLPGSREQTVINYINGSLYLFGGRGYNSIAGNLYQSDLWSFDPATYNWTWLKGPSGKEYNGVYGTQGVASETNKPGGRVAPGSIGANDKFYLFGGTGLASNGYGGNLNDLWEYSPTNNNWTWLKGSNAGGAGNYGTIGVASITNLPPGRESHMLWNIGNKIYLFGGTVLNYFNDLWEYDLTTNNWTWLKGSNIVNQSGNYGTKGVSAATNTPGARWLASTFTYNNKIYLCGGNGYNSGATRGELNDLWEYDPATNNWTWLSGNDAINSLGIYGTIAVPSATNLPGARESGQMQTINNKAYLFGGRGYAVSGGFSNLNDMWEYDPVTNSWTWIKGPNTGGGAGVAGSIGIENAANNPSARYYETSWTLNNKFYVFSGTPFGPEYNDVWEYNPASNNWRFIHGTGNIGGQPGNYGLTGIGNRLNLPTRRWQSTAAAAGGNAFIFGGLGSYANNSTTSNQYLGDLWKWAPGPDGVFTYGFNHKIYVNDINLTGDTYTTAIGNNLNTGTPSAPLATVDFAVSVAQPGDTIFVDAGFYQNSVNIVINKSITLLGTNYQVSPNDQSDPLQPNLARFSESVVVNHNFTIGAGNIRIKGFYLDPASKTQIQQTVGLNDFDNIEIEKNIFSSTSNFAVINITGRQQTPLITTNYIISNNRFEKDFGTGGTNITLNYINGINISGNVFTIANNSLARIQSAISIGTTGKVDNLTIAENIFDRTNSTISTTRIGATLVDDNKCYDVQTALSLSNSITEPATLTITRNYLENVRSGNPLQLIRSGGSDASGVNRVIVEDNFISFNATGQSFGAVIVPSFTSTVANAEALVRRNKINYTGDCSLFTVSSPLGVRPAGKINVITIENNEIDFTGTNLSISAGGLIPSTGIVIFSNSGSAATSLPSNAVITILNNKVNGFKQSVIFYNIQTSQYGGLASGISANINNNSFTGDIISINNGTTSQTVNANCNWYGVTSAQAVITKVTPTTVNYIPWLANGTDIDIPTVGFQPMADVCNGTAPVITLDASTDITCNGDNDGTISITVSGGLALFTFAWTKDEDIGFSSSDEDPTNLAPGTYNLLVTDANGSTATLLNVTINEPEVLTAEASGTNNICFDAIDGSAIALPGGGTAPYTFLWSNAETTEEITGLAAGTYSVTVTDANGCTAIANYEVTQPSQLTATITNTSTACANSASVAASGGTVAAAYSYLWSNGATGTTISNVPAGTYTVTITDDNGCTTSANVDLTTNEAFNPSAQVTDVSCFGESDGTMTLTNVNGAAPFQYSIDGFNFQAENVFENLSVGTYTVTVLDANGCTGFVTKIIAQPPLLTVMLDNVQSTCFGFSTGSITVTASGGSGAMSYSWTGPNGFTSTQRNINTLATAEYSLTVTDNNSCTVNLQVVVPSIDEIVVTSVVTNITCKGYLNGAIDILVSGGTGGGFTYNWSNNATEKDIANLGVGNYNVAITDIGSGCVVTRSFTITQPATTVNLSTTKTNATGCNSLGTITATGSGGTPGYQYSINGIDYQVPNLFTGLYAGSYTVWVKDANGCTKTAVVTITDNGSDEYESNNSKNQSKIITIGTTINARIALANDAADWFKFTTPSGGGGNYTLTFTHPLASFTFNMLPGGNNAPALIPLSTTPVSKEYALSGNTTYYISVTGELSYICYSLTVSAPSFLTKTNSTINTVMEKIVNPLTDLLKAKAYPNPHHGSFALSIDSPEDGMATVELFNSIGQKIIERKFSVIKGEGNTVQFTNIRNSVLFYRLKVGMQVVNGKIMGPN